MEKKVCVKCGKRKLVDEFPKNRNVCKDCKAEYLREYRKHHPDKKRSKEYERDKSREYRARLKEKRGCTYPNDEYARKHRERQKEYEKNRRVKNEEYRERMRKYGRNYYHREVMKQEVSILENMFECISIYEK